MSRIFFSLGVLALLMMAATLSIGLYLGGYKARLVELATEIKSLQGQGGSAANQQAAGELVQKRARLVELVGWFRVHMLLGVATSLTVILVNCIAVTYFIGTGRWCREVVETYQLEPALAAQSQRLKRRSFPWATLGIVAALSISALGAAADPGNTVANAEYWVTPHMAAAFGGFLLIAVAFFIQWANISENHGVIDEIVARVEAVRRQRGLD
ncbi:MAG: hypothetical protein K8T91_26775 [Planctomycetes bacterium]|nr:hypothetical protein [Planctomycetota bacterium]